MEEDRRCVACRICALVRKAPWTIWLSAHSPCSDRGRRQSALCLNGPELLGLAFRPMGRSGNEGYVESKLPD